MRSWLMVGLLCMCGCSLNYGDFKSDLLRMPHEKEHASIEKLGVKGFQLETVAKESGFPKITLGTTELNSVFLPKVICTDYYNEEGVITSKVCETMPDIVIDARTNPLGNGIVDNLATGQASLVYHSPEDEGTTQTYAVWIEAIQSAVSQSDADNETKQKWMDSLKGIAELLKNITLGDTE